MWHKCNQSGVTSRQRLSLRKLWHDAVTQCNPVLWSNPSWMMQQAGGGWSVDQAQGERGDLQRSARASAHGGLLPDPKEDANRVIEDILAVSAAPAQNPALVLSPCLGDNQQCMSRERERDFILLASCSVGEEAALETTLLSCRGAMWALGILHGLHAMGAARAQRAAGTHSSRAPQVAAVLPRAPTLRLTSLASHQAWCLPSHSWHEQAVLLLWQLMICHVLPEPAQCLHYFISSGSLANNVIWGRALCSASHAACYCE